MFNLERWGLNPLLRADQYAYCIARVYHEGYARRTTHEQKVGYLPWAFRRHVAPGGLIAKAAAILTS